MNGQLDPIELMKTINELEYKISALATIQTGGIWTDWTPDLTQYGTMTLTSTTISMARYCVIGETCFVNCEIIGTLGGTPINAIYVSMPKYAYRTDKAATLSAFAVQTSADIVRPGLLTFSSGGLIGLVYKYDASNYTGATVKFGVSGFYKFTTS